MSQKKHWESVQSSCGGTGKINGKIWSISSTQKKNEINTKTTNGKYSNVTKMPIKDMNI